MMRTLTPMEKELSHENETDKEKCNAERSFYLTAFVAANTQASSPGGDFLGQSFRRNIILANKCRLNSDLINKYEESVPQAIIKSNATTIYKEDALAAFRNTPESFFNASEIMATQQNCDWVSKRINNLIEKEGN